MQQYLRNLWEQFVGFWNDLNRRQKYVLGGIVSITVLVSAGLLYWSMQPQWVVLYNRQLEVQEASKIARELENIGVPYRLDGNVIKVPFSRVQRLRLQLAESGIQPTSTVGFEIFEQGGIGITDFERQVRYKRALEGSLARSIMTNPTIENAQVHISLQREPALFKEDEEPVKASIKVETKPYESLSRENVEGIINLVSYGVVGLEPKNVAVLNQNDRILSDFRKEEGGLTSSKVRQLQVRERIESKLEQKLRTSLGRVLTPDRLSTAVTVNMDFDRIEKRMEHYRQPEGAFEQLKASEKQTSRKLSGRDVQPGGPAGAESNIPGAEAVDTGGVTRYSEDKSVVNYFADKNVTTITKDPAITRVSATVTVDGQYNQVTGEDGSVKFEYQPPGEEKMAKIERLAKAAIGFNEQRGDQIAVTNLQFDRSEEIARRRQKAQQTEYQRKLSYFIAAAIGLTLFVGAIIFWWIRRGQPEEEAEETRPEIPSRDLMAEVSIEEQQREETRERIQEAAKDNPETVAQILRTWFVEEA